MSTSQRPGHGSGGRFRWTALALGAIGLVVYAALQVHSGRAVVPSIIGATLGIVVLLLLARRH
jgi:hypothetical protein